MTLSCTAGFDVGRLRHQVLSMYERVAHAPEGNFHFHRGLEYAVEQLRYERGELLSLPARSTARFAGIGNPHRIGPILAGSTVLDHACGAGMDLLIAARRVGPAGRVIGVDMTPGMRECAAAAAREAGLEHIVEIRAGLFEELPVADASVDYVISNGVVNLAPDKHRVFSEIRRVLRPGGQLYLADVVLERELAAAARQDPDLWAACVGGALTETALVQLAAEAGLQDGRIVESFECFRNTSVERKFSRAMRIYGVSFHARKL
jgi:arsenite methyltransferase